MMVLMQNNTQRNKGQMGLYKRYHKFIEKKNANNHLKMASHKWVTMKTVNALNEKLKTLIWNITRPYHMRKNAVFILSIFNKTLKQLVNLFV